MFIFLHYDYCSAHIQMSLVLGVLTWFQSFLYCCYEYECLMANPI